MFLVDVRHPVTVLDACIIVVLLAALVGFVIFKTIIQSKWSKTKNEEEE